MLIFKSGKFRIMGGVEDLEAHFNIYSVTMLYNCIPNIILQTMTCVYQYSTKIPLPLLANNILSFYTPESFPAVQVRKFQPIHVNVFESGKVIITGVRDYSVAMNIKNQLDLLIDSLL